MIKDPEIEINGGDEPLPENAVDVTVVLGRTRYFLTFVSLKSVEKIMTSYQATGECGSGIYFWATDLIIVRELSKEIILQSAKEIVESLEIENFSSRQE